MDRQAANLLIRDVFDHAFDRARFQRFVNEVVNEYEPKENRWSGNVISDAFKDHVRYYERLGTYTDPDGTEIEILMVNLRRESALDRARTMQRNFVAHHLKTRGEREAALVAYYHDELPNWRFSLVRMDYRAVQDEETGHVKITEDLTPARRASFLVGAEEPNHTAQTQLHPFLLRDRRNPTLDELEEAFSIESVTKEFFGRYKELFLDLKEELDRVAARDAVVAAEFERCAIDTATFAKKLMGQIVFLYFLQKKGWLGVEPGAEWGSGPRKFMRKLFAGDYGGYENFFNDVLEPLFYNALAVERPDDLYAPIGRKIPFLNGGLFEPTGGYDWRATDLLIDNEIFRAVLDAFDLYNFTVREDEPLEKEVAVDPEMLGKVFENLLEVNDRKAAGAFYTPREIVHYMCQESLINYLDTALNLQEVPATDAEPTQDSFFGDTGRQTAMTATEYRPAVPREEIATFIRLGELAMEHDAAKEAGTKSYDHWLPDSVRAHAKALDTALADVKVCDPAIGSGAFPVGIMHEIVRAREVLTTYLADARSQTFDKSLTSEPPAARTTYNLKRHAIQESIYGVDIDPSAVDIAKLRLWLSLVVDEEDYRTIKPLPNLDYKIVCGNSLLSVEKNLLNHQLFEQLDTLKRKYFIATHPQDKLRLRAQIDQLIGLLTEGERRFDFEIYFHEVFAENGGFDVVIGNPPYIRHELIKDLKPELKSCFPQVYQGTADIYVYFYACGIQMLRPHGSLAFITSNKFMRAAYGKKLRNLLQSKTSITAIIDFGDLPVFDATAYPCVLITSYLTLFWAVQRQPLSSMLRGGKQPSIGGKDDCLQPT